MVTLLSIQEDLIVFIAIIFTRLSTFLDPPLPRTFMSYCITMYTRYILLLLFFFSSNTTHASFSLSLFLFFWFLLFVSLLFLNTVSRKNYFKSTLLCEARAHSFPRTRFVLFAGMWITRSCVCHKLLLARTIITGTIKIAPPVRYEPPAALRMSENREAWTLLHASTAEL